MEPPRESTLYQNLDVPYKKAATALAVDSTGSYAALGGKKGIYITDLEEPWDQPKLLHHGAKQTQWDTHVIQWNPHAEHSTMVASAANKDVFIWNVNDKRTPLLATWTPHARPVADLCWALLDANVLATCSADMYVNLWDVRSPASALKLKAFCAWTSGATMVKWNRRNPRLLASVHEGEVFVWDVRKESAPITKITAHKQITSMDWSYHSESQLVTSSSDRSVKFWDYQQPSVCQAILQTANPISKVKYTPFGRAIITSSQRSDLSIRMWSLSDLEQPLIQFMGHKDVIAALDWRTCDLAGEDYEYQLLSWSKDSNLRFWPIDLSLINAMQAREVYGAGRSTLPSASTSLSTTHNTKDAFGTSLGVYPSLGNNSLVGSDLPTTGSPSRKSLVFGSQVNGGPNGAGPNGTGPNGGASQLTSGSSTHSLFGTNPLSSTSSTPSQTLLSFPPASNNASSSVTITNLEQEFAMLQRRPIQGVMVEDFSLSHRTIQIRLGRLPYMLRLKITFPSLYPNFAAPSFEFLTLTEGDMKPLLSLGAGSPKTHSLLSAPSKLTDEEKFQLILKSKHLLSKVAYAFVSINLVCIYPCCNQLFELLESFHSNPKLVMQPEDHDQDLNIRPEEYYKSFSLSSNSVPSTPSKSGDFSSAASASSLTSVSSILSSSPASKDRSIPRLTFSETTSGAHGATSIALSPPLIKPLGLPPTSDVSIPKTKSDMNLSQYLDTEYLHSARGTGTTAGGTSSTKIPTSQSAINLTSLTDISSESTAPLSASAHDKPSVLAAATMTNTSQLGVASNIDASNASHAAQTSVGTTSAVSVASVVSTSSAHSTAEVGSYEPEKHNSARSVTSGSDSLGDLKLAGRVNSSTSIGSASATASRGKGNLWPSDPNAEDKSTSHTNTVTQAPKDGLKHVASTTDLLGEDYLSNPIPAPRTFGAIFFATGQICMYGIKSKVSSNGAVSANKVSSSVRTYSDFLQVLSATGKRPLLNASYNDLGGDDERFQEETKSGKSTTGRSSGRTLAKLPRAVSMSAMAEMMDVDRSGEESEEDVLHRVSSDLNLKALSSQIASLRSLRSDVRVEWFDSIVMHDLSMLVPVSPQLARMYRVAGPSTSAICVLNAQAAKSIRRKDLVKTWSMVEAQTHPALYPGLTPLANHPHRSFSPFDHAWAQHPLGRTLLHSIFENYARLRDVQTLAILSCVIAGPATPYGIDWHLTATPAKSPMIPHTHHRLPQTESGLSSPNHSSSSLSSSSSTSSPKGTTTTTTHHQRSSSLASAASLMGNLLGGPSHTSTPSTAPQYPLLPPHAVTAPYHTHSASMAATASLGAGSSIFSSSSHTDYYAASRNTASLGKNALTQTKSLAASHAGLSRDKNSEPLLPPPPTSNAPLPPSSMHHNHHSHNHTHLSYAEAMEQHSLLDPAKEHQYNQYRRTYAEMLYMWGEYSERAQILKYVADPTPPNDGIDFVILCERCAKPLKTPYCQNCRIYGFNCDICHLRVKGLSTWCLKCGHGGHADHLKKWFATESVCPAGCGCICMELDD